MPSNDNLYALLVSRFTGASNPAFIVPSGETLSYQELDALVGRYAGALVRLGVKPGDRVTVQIEKSLAGAALYLAALRMGAVYNPLNTAYTASELEYFISDAQPTVLVVAPEKADAISRSALEHGVLAVETLDADDLGSMAALARDAAPFASVEQLGENNLAAILYTSGTTGKSKGAMITHGNLISNIAALHEAWAFQPGDVLLHALPIYHVHGLFVALGTALYNASPIIWLPKFDATQVADLLPKATVMMGVPTFYTRLLDEPTFDAALVKHMRLFVAGSAPLLAETHAKFFDRTGHYILERYGMTETGMITSNPYDGARIAGTVGYPLPGVTVRVADAEGLEMTAGEPGVIEVNGPNVFSGYWRMPQKTCEEFRGDGYFITGDIGVREADGRISIVGRAKDLIITGGFNVYPKEIETEIDAMPGVVESAVVGVPHPDFGEGVIAIVVTNGAALAEPEIISALKEKLARFKLPKRVFFVTDLPRNAMGKVQKAELRARYAATFKA
ncbi:MAG: malonyl-CoA synthase [Hyphomicrobiales bacterium]|nr:malonyl-CoA synthase [Hyphomicrobiales bacterium]